MLPSPARPARRRPRFSLHHLLALLLATPLLSAASAATTNEPGWWLGGLTGSLLLLLIAILVALRFARLSARLRDSAAERALVEENLRHSENRFHALFTHLANGFALHEAVRDSNGQIVDYRYLEVNPAFARMMGLTEEQLVGHRVSEILPDSKKYWLDNFRAVVEQGQSVNLENHSRQLGRWLATHAYRPAPGQFAIIVEDITERKQLQMELERQARTDYLTGLINRRYFIDHCQQELTRTLRYGHPLSLLMLDIDHFKKVNDTYGHLAGDQVLQALAACCQAQLREVDIAGRIGGEEFTILLPETDAGEACEVAERLRQMLADLGVAQSDGPPIRFTVSIGVACVGAATNTIDQLLQHADEALYQAKNNGRNRVCLFGAAMSS